MKQDINHSFGLDVILSSSSPKNHSHVNSPVRQNLTENRRNKNMKDNNHITFNFLLNDSKTETQNKKMYKLLEKESNRKQNQERSFSIGSKRNIETTNMDSNEPEPKRQRMNVHDEISRGQWSQKEHDLFLQGLEECGRGRWKEIASRFVTSRTARQISSHAQKYFIKVNAGSYTRRESVADQHPDEAYDHGRSTSSPEWLNSNNFFRFCYGKRRKRKTQDKNREHENVSHESKGREEPLEEEEEKEKPKRKGFECRAEFHREERYDYLGRPWLTPPSHLRPDTEHECFIPKKHVHTWQGHSKGKGVTAIRFFPGYGHLLLSASQDSTCKIWDVTSDYDCVQTYKGHMKPVRDIRFQSDGKRFASAGYDKNVRLWDTETGDVVTTLSNGRIPYCVRIHPNNPNEVLVGTHDKKIIQYDIRTREQVQVYDQHLGPVNTITFLDNGRRFVTSSDDKTLRVWEYGIPVVIKYIAEPHMHSMPSIAVHPNNKWFAAQSLDNQILVYGARDKFRLNSKKRFVGHMVAGFACQVNFSPDGRFLMSGDSDGRVFFWDWKNCRKIKTIKAHEGVAIGCEWHPLEPSKVATCGWDGMIKYWD
eukprot:gb/GECH01004731.1/.p1 GENE.gb/GECH01004731.1/~~gb/GECH01004731.1/.p1  ORF type:complete len:593 (+),score=109.36 gb/GECH01004731.1/:1-1779(+)